MAEKIIGVVSPPPIGPGVLATAVPSIQRDEPHGAPINEPVIGLGYKVTGSVDVSFSVYPQKICLIIGLSGWVAAGLC